MWPEFAVAVGSDVSGFGRLTMKGDCIRFGGRPRGQRGDVQASQPPGFDQERPVAPLFALRIR